MSPQQSKGRVSVRMPTGMHEALIEAADRQGVTLNQFVCATLAGAIAWRAGEQDRREEAQLTREEQDAAKWEIWNDLFR
jgi:hypothetical protein